MVDCFQVPFGNVQTAVGYGTDLVIECLRNGQSDAPQHGGYYIIHEFCFWYVIYSLGFNLSLLCERPTSSDTLWCHVRSGDSCF